VATTLTACECAQIADIEVSDEMLTILAIRMIEVFGGADEAIAALSY
jgi:hypothetical protein